MSSKIPTTLSIDKNIKTDFKIECVTNGVDMSDMVEQMMSDYVKVSQEIRNERELRSKEKLNDVG